MTIAPDTKDWTWVLERRCPQCGFDASLFPASQVPARARGDLPAWSARLALPDARIRPDESTWSPLEYGAHVRDVFRLFRTRLALMLNDEDPLFANWDQDASAIEERYEGQDPSVVVGELTAAAHDLASHLDRIDVDEWERTGRRSDGVAFTVASIVRYMIHDPIHHVWDVNGLRRGTDAATGR